MTKRDKAALQRGGVTVDSELAEAAAKIAQAIRNAEEPLLEALRIIKQCQSAKGGCHFCKRTATDALRRR